MFWRDVPGWAMDRWERRLQAWLADDEAPRPLLLVVVDGLNERPDIDWTDFFRPLRHARLRGRVVVLATDRPGHWSPKHERLELDGFCPIAVDGYTDLELAQALVGSGIDLSEIPPDLHELIRTPRYCSLVREHFDEMTADQDFTKERLVLMDARHRRNARRGHPLTQDDFLDLMRGLASRWKQKPDFRRDDLRALLPGIDADQRVYQEIIDGGLLVRQGGAGVRYTVEPTRLVFGLGMLLAEDVRDAANGATEAAVAETVAAWFEPHPEMDLKVQICASAIFHALLEPEFSQAARRELIRFWLSSRNRFDNGDEARLAFVLRAPADFISIAESFWSARGDKGSAQAYLATAFGRYRGHPRLEPLLVQAIERWSGYIHPAGQPLLRHGGRADDAARRAAIANRIGRAPAPGPLEVAGKPLTVVEDDNLLRLVRFGFLIMSAGDRRPFAGALAIWAVGAAVSGGAVEQDVAAWVVRLAQDNPEPGILAEARPLLERGGVAAEAGHTLLQILGTKSAAQMRDHFPQAVSPARARQIAEHEAAPCRSMYGWTDAQCEHCIENSDTRLHTLVQRAELKLLDPDRTIPGHVAERLAHAIGSRDPAEIHANFLKDHETQQFEELLPFVAATTPDAVLRVVRQTVATMSARSLEGQRQLALEMPKIYPVLRDPEMIMLKTVIADLRGGASRWPRPGSEQNAAQTTEAFSTWGLLPHLDPDERYRSLTERPPHAFDFDDFDLWFDPPSETVAQEALNIIRSGERGPSLIRALWLAAQHRAALSDADRDAIVSLADAPDTLVRGAALRFACLSNDHAIGQRMADFGRSYENLDDTWETEWGNELLTKFGAHVGFDALVRRVDPGAAGFLLVARGCRDVEVRIYADILGSIWNDATSASPASGVAPPHLWVRPSDGRLGSGLQPLADEPQTTRTIVSASASWTSGSEAHGGGLEDLLRPPDVGAEMHAAQSRRDAAATARRTPAFRWFSHRFHPAALAAVFRIAPEMVGGWADEASSPGRDGRQIRVRLGSFCYHLCETMLEVDPARGIRLLQALRSREGTVRFDESELLFAAPASPAVMAAREALLWRCWSDSSVAEFARAAQSADDGWLISMIQQLAEAPALSNKALGLALAAFSHRDAAEFESFVSLADAESTWLSDTLPALRRHHHRDALASEWFEKFRNESTDELAWAALQVVSHLADERFENRFDGLVEDPQLNPERARMLEMNRLSIRRSFRKVRNRNDRLFGIKIARNEIWPFVGSDAIF